MFWNQEQMDVVSWEKAASLSVWHLQKERFKSHTESFPLNKSTHQ